MIRPGASPWEVFCGLVWHLSPNCPGGSSFLSWAPPPLGLQRPPSSSSSPCEGSRFTPPPLLLPHLLREKRRLQSLRTLCPKDPCGGGHPWPPCPYSWSSSPASDMASGPASLLAGVWSGLQAPVSDK